MKLNAFMLLAPLLLSAPAQAASAFGLQITPKGEQKLNLATGSTDMPQGGTIRDNKLGVKVVAAVISVRRDTITASGITLTTRQGGTLRADNLVYNPQQAQVSATGNLNYSDARVKGLSAQTIYVDTRSGAVTAVGNVKTTAPQASAAQLVALPLKNQMLLGGAAKIMSGGQWASADKILFNLAAGKGTLNPKAGDLGAFAPYLK